MNDHCLPLLYRKSTFFWYTSGLNSEFASMSYPKQKRSVLFSPQLDLLCVGLFSVICNKTGKKWRKLIKRSIFWSKISKKDYLQKGATSFMFKNRHNKFLYSSNFDKKTRKLIVTSQINIFASLFLCVI